MSRAEPLVKIKNGKPTTIANVAEAAEMKGCTRVRIYQLLTSGKPDSEGYTYMRLADYEALHLLDNDSQASIKHVSTEEPRKRPAIFKELEGIGGGIANTKGMLAFMAACRKELAEHFAAIEIEFKTDRQIIDEGVTVIMRIQLVKGATFLSDVDYIYAKGWVDAMPWKDMEHYTAFEKSKDFSLEG